jgi:ribosomal protein RSM22 (predicted rRNA methylase)
VHAPDYPEALEVWWLSCAARLVADEAATEEARWSVLAAALARLCEGFTSDRAAGLAGYAARDDDLAAYGLFYFPQSYVRMRLLLAETEARGAAATVDRPLRVLDLGAGLGAATAAAAAHAAATRPDAAVEIVAVDRAPAALALLRAWFGDLAPALFPCARLETRAADAASPTAAEAGPWDLVLASMTVNEIFEHRTEADLRAWAEDLLERLAPDGRLIICEPGTPASARRLQTLRDAWAAEGSVTVLAPCPHHAPCPMLVDPGAWCHDVRRWNAPASAWRINRHTHLALDVLRFSLLAVEKTPRAAEAAEATEAAPDAARLVAPPFATAGRIVFRGCAANGALETYETLTRALSREARQELAALERGDRVRWTLERRLGDGRWRASVADHTPSDAAAAPNGASPAGTSPCGGAMGH